MRKIYRIKYLYKNEWRLSGEIAAKQLTKQLAAYRAVYGEACYPQEDLDLTENLKGIA